MVRIAHERISLTPPLFLPLFSLCLRQVEQLTSQLKEKADWCSELLLNTEQRSRELRERDEEIDKLESRVRELEQALLASAESLERVRRGRAPAVSGCCCRRSGREAGLVERENNVWVRLHCWDGHGVAASDCRRRPLTG